MRKIPKDLDFFDLLGWMALAAAIIGAPAKAVRRVMRRHPNREG